MLENVLKRGEVEGGDLTFWEAWSSMVSDDMCDESCSAIFDGVTIFCGSFSVDVW